MASTPVNMYSTYDKTCSCAPFENELRHPLQSSSTSDTTFPPINTRSLRSNA